MSDSQFASAVSIIADEIKTALESLTDEIKKDTYEIRLRRGMPIVLYGKYGSVFLRRSGGASYSRQDAFILEARALESIFARLCDYSVHTHLSTLVKGYITMSSGHRVGVAATAVTDSGGNVTSIKDISSLNIRICREIKGCGDEIIDRVFEGRLRSVIIAGPPSSGKTTVLRDLVRQLSGPSGQLYKVCIADERHEIAAMRDGIAGYDIGLNCDVLTAFPKYEAIMCAVRTLSPDIIAVDEVASDEEIHAIAQGVNSGVKFIVTVHASSYEEIIHRPQIQKLINTYSFTKLILLGEAASPRRIKEVFEIKELRDEILRGGNAMAGDGPLGYRGGGSP